MSRTRAKVPPGTREAIEDEIVQAVETLKRKLEEVLTRPKVTYQDAQEASEAAQLIGDLIRVEQRALRLVGRTETDPDPGRAGEMAGLTLDEAARRVLREEGRPMHARELGARIKARGWRHPRSKVARPDQIIFQLAARLPRQPDFERVAPNTFALRGWDQRPPGPRPRPRGGIFSGTGDPLAEWIGDHPEAPHEDERAQWHSS